MVSRRLFLFKSLAVSGAILGVSVLTKKGFASSNLEKSRTKSVESTKDYYTYDINRDKCIGCGECIDPNGVDIVSECPTQAVWVDDDGVPHIDQEICLSCGVCYELGYPICSVDAFEES